MLVKSTCQIVKTMSIKENGKENIASTPLLNNTIYKIKMLVAINKILNLRY